MISKGLVQKIMNIEFLLKVTQGHQDKSKDDLILIVLKYLRRESWNGLRRSLFMPFVIVLGLFLFM